MGVAGAAAGARSVTQVAAGHRLFRQARWLTSPALSALLCSSLLFSAQGSSNSALTRTRGVSPRQLAVAATSQSCVCSSSHGSSSANEPSARRGWAAADRARWQPAAVGHGTISAGCAAPRAALHLVHASPHSTTATRKTALCKTCLAAQQLPTSC